MESSDTVAVKLRYFALSIVILLLTVAMIVLPIAMTIDRPSMMLPEFTKSNFENVDYKKNTTLIVDTELKKLTETYIISLSEDAYLETKQKIVGAFDDPQADIKKFSAIRGDSLDSTILSNKKLLTTGALYDITIPLHRRTHQELGSKNAIGCYLSHTTLWKKLLDSDKEGFFIFETDAICTKSVVEYTKNFLDNYKDGHILFFSISNEGRAKNHIEKINDKFYGMFSYFITRKGAEVLLKYAFPIEQQIDAMLSDILLLSKVKDSGIPPINFYLVNACLHLSRGMSSIQTKQVACIE